MLTSYYVLRLRKNGDVIYVLYADAANYKMLFVCNMA